MKVSVIFTFLFTTVYASPWFQSCSYLRDLDCTNAASAVICGTNHVTYNSNCDFAKAHCRDRTLYVKHRGECTGKPELNINPHKIAFEVFCQAFLTESCGNEEEIVCSSDLKTYRNLCEFEKSKCLNRLLKLHHIGHC
ncbi:ovomucoid-like [Octopus vulgaris]|uniref:Ovomucoid-like n=2 Tax=Octopus TaxID=6643 RepID=A0AA36BVD0_OCTVU|nr:ovomucoid-like [Octopus sinensis]CAI9741045.1 ovomucoid-like [Octopus vulgaris]